MMVQTATALAVGAQPAANRVSIVQARPVGSVPRTSPVLTVGNVPRTSPVLTAPSPGLSAPSVSKQSDLKPQEQSSPVLTVSNVPRRSPVLAAPSPGLVAPPVSKQSNLKPQKQSSPVLTVANVPRTSPVLRVPSPGLATRQGGMSVVQAKQINVSPRKAVPPRTTPDLRGIQPPQGRKSVAMAVPKDQPRNVPSKPSSEQTFVRASTAPALDTKAPWSNSFKALAIPAKAAGGTSASHVVWSSSGVTPTKSNTQPRVTWGSNVKQSSMETPPRLKKQFSMETPPRLKRVGWGTLSIRTKGGEDSVTDTPTAAKVFLHHELGGKFLCCPRGHDMNAKVTHEMFDFQRLRKFNHVLCARCNETISEKDAAYRCTVCDYEVCVPCASITFSPPIKTPSDVMIMRKALKQPGPVEIMAGDILLCGPDRWNIHHVVLARGSMTLADEDVYDAVSPPLGIEIYECETIECSQAESGKDTNWQMYTSFYTRNLFTGEALQIGDMAPGSLNLQCYETPIPVKVLIHPMRPGRGGPVFMPWIFNDCVNSAAARSKKYGVVTAVRAFVTNPSELNPKDYPNPFLRSKLMEDIRRRWQTPPFCASVAVMIWQMYFQASCHNDADPGLGQDCAVQLLLERMPLYCDQATPSTLVKTLTLCGWRLHGNFEA